MKHQPLIASYRRDFEWLFHMLRSFAVNARGFLPPVVVVPDEDRDAAEPLVREANPETILRTSAIPARHLARVWASFMRAQIAMLSGDLHCPDADVIWLFGSDCFVSGPITPEQQVYCRVPIMPFNTYEHLRVHHADAACWKPGTLRALGLDRTDCEFMRRLPLLYPRELYARVRDRIADVAGMDFEDAVYELHGPQRDFSESNVLGTFAWFWARHLYHWVNIDDGPELVPPTNVIQFWSHGGMDLPCDQFHPYAGQTPREVMDQCYRRARERTEDSIPLAAESEPAGCHR